MSIKENISIEMRQTIIMDVYLMDKTTNTSMYLELVNLFH